MIGATDAPDGDQLTANVIYRLAYGEAYRVAEVTGTEAGRNGKGKLAPAKA